MDIIDPNISYHGHRGPVLQSDNSDKILSGNGGATEDQQQDEPGGRHSETLRLGNSSTSIKSSSVSNLPRCAYMGGWSPAWS